MPDTAAPALEQSAGVAVKRPANVGPRLADDRELPALGMLFDEEWAWQQFCATYGVPEQPPVRLSSRHFSYEPGRRAVLTYVAEWQWPENEAVIEEEFTIELRAGHRARVFRYPDDPYLPGLAAAASAVSGEQLIQEYLGVHPRGLQVDTVRYRPTTRAVLRHKTSWRSVGRITFYVRVMAPARVPRLLAAAELAGHSGFVLPRMSGCWPEGGVVWLARIPGENVRRLIRHGKAPDPDLILEPLARLWQAPAGSSDTYVLDVVSAFRHTDRVLSGVLEGESARALEQVKASLAPFVAQWRPTAIAHNDFYDDQMIMAPGGRVAIVDFEETGPGDPLMDVGNMLAHLRWMATFGSKSEYYAPYHDQFRSAALARFGWSERELAMREGFALFRLASNPVRKLPDNWQEQVGGTLSLAMEVLSEAK